MTALKVVQIGELAFNSEARNTDIGRIILIHFIEVVNFEERKENLEGGILKENCLK